MKIGVVASHAWPLPSPARTGDSQVLLDLTRSLYQMGHDVRLFAPEGTKAPDGVELMPMPLCSHGQAEPTTQQCEDATLSRYARELRECDIVHDCSVNKLVAESLNAIGHPTVSTIWGGAWSHPNPARNIIVQSYAQRERMLRGATDYENTDTPEMGGPNVAPIKDAHVVYNGIDTDFYCPSDYSKDGYLLWLNRWHPVKGYRQMLELAEKYPELEIVMAGEHPDRDHPYQAQCALECVERAKAMPNVRIEFLPADPEHHGRKRRLYREARGFLFPTQFQEPFGLSQIEAMACGTLVFGVQRGSVPEILSNPWTGVVSAPGEWIDDFPVIRDDPRTGPECREEAVRRFDRFVMARNYIEQYRLVLAGKGWGA